MKVDLLIDGPIKHAKGLKMKADQKSVNLVRDKIKPRSHTTFIVVDKSDDSTDGIALRGMACDQMNGHAIAISENLQDDEALTANTLAHEIGHSLGMRY